LIKQRYSKAAGLLALIGVLDGQGIPDYLLAQHFDSVLAFENALSLLLSFSFVSSTKEGSVIKMHFLVQLATRRWLEKSHESNTELENWQSAPLAILAKVFPKPDFESRQICGDLWPHVQLILKYNFPSISETQRAVLLEKAGMYDLYEYRFKMASKRLVDALEVRQKLLGQDHPETLKSYHSLSSVRLSQGKFNEAMRYCQLAFDVRTSTLGIEDPDTIATMGQMASIYESLGENIKASNMQLQTMEACKRVHSEEAP
jgi:hypothetical protein